MKLLVLSCFLAISAFSQDALFSMDRSQAFDVNECGKEGSHIICKTFTVTDEAGKSVKTFRRIFNCYAYGENYFHTTREEASKFYSTEKKCLGL